MKVEYRMRQMFAVAALAALGGALPAHGQARPAPAVAVIPPAQPVAGASQEEWSRRWWRWALSFDEDEGPVADPDGSDCALGQRGPVWFLAGTYGTARTVRSCRVPAGKTLFFPLVNTVALQPEDEDEPCTSLKHRAAESTDSPAGLVLEVNGRRFKSLAAHRQATQRCFRVLDDDTLAAANGYYVAIGPLKPGRYTLNFGGILSELSQAVTYTLDVE